jgi:hypothetical protein
VVVLEEPIIFSFFARGASSRGVAKAIITSLAGSILGDMAVRGAGELGSQIAEGIAGAVEGVAEGARKKAHQEYAYKGSKFIETEFGKPYYIAIGATRVGIFRPKGLGSITGVVTGVEPVVVVPRAAIRQVTFQEVRGEANRALIIVFIDGGFVGFWVPRPAKSRWWILIPWWGAWFLRVREIMGKEIYEGVSAAFSKPASGASRRPTPSD